MVNRDIVYNKISIIERCIIRINEVYENDEQNFNDYTKQDSIVLNLQRAIEATIDLAMHVVSDKKIGIPQNSSDAFMLLSENNIIDNELFLKLQRMIGFRNIAVHEYQQLDSKVIIKIINNNLTEFNKFAEIIMKLDN